MKEWILVLSRTEQPWTVYANPVLWFFMPILQTAGNCSSYLRGAFLDNNETADCDSAE